MSESVARKIFGVSEFQVLSLDSLRKIYRNLSKKHHPDLVGNSKYHLEKMQEINLAYETLKNLATNTEENIGPERYSYVDVDEYKKSIENSLSSTSQVEYDAILGISKNNEYLNLIMYYANIEYDLRENFLKNLKYMKTPGFIDREFSILNRSICQNAKEFFKSFINNFHKFSKQELLNDEYYLDYLDDYIDEVTTEFKCKNIYESLKYAMEVKKGFNIRILQIKVDDYIDEIIDFCIPENAKNIYNSRRDYIISKVVNTLCKNSYEIVSDFKIKTTILKVLGEHYKNNFIDYHKRITKIRKLKNKSIIYNINLDSEISHLESLTGNEFNDYCKELETILNTQINNINKKR